MEVMPSGLEAEMEVTPTGSGVEMDIVVWKRKWVHGHGCGNGNDTEVDADVMAEMEVLTKGWRLECALTSDHFAHCTI